MTEVVAVELENVSEEDQKHLEDFEKRFTEILNEFDIQFSIGVDADDNLRVMVGVPSKTTGIVASTDLVDPVPMSSLVD